MKLAEVFAPVVDLIYPSRCPLCGDAIAEQNGLCVTCWSTLVIPAEPCCAMCQRPLAIEGEHPDTICAPCLAKPPKHAGVSAATLYNDASRRLVLSYKHGGKIALAPMLARLINARLPALEGDWLIVPVPLHPWRLWQRGFNQSALLAKEVAHVRGQTLLVDGLLRTKRTPSLGGLGRRERAKVLQGAITANPKRSAVLKGARVVLMDDVMTSGATTDACTAALRKAGAKQVRIACFARVLDEAL